MPNFGHSKFLPVFLYQKGLNKFRMCIVRKISEWSFLAIPNLYQSLCEKLSEKIQNGHFWPFFMFGTHLIHWPLHPMQHLARCNNNCDVTVAMLPNTTAVIWVTITSVLECTEQSPVQIRAHYHKDVHTNINKKMI